MAEHRAGSPRLVACGSTALATAALCWPRGCPAQAQDAAKGPPIIRDAEIEQLLREYTQPILRAAGLAKQNVQVVIINDRVVQRLRRRRPPHLHQCRRADGRRRRRTRSSACWRTRPATSPAATWRACASSSRQAHDRNRSSPCCSASAPWSRRARSGSAASAGRHGGHSGAAGHDPALAARLCAHPGRPGRPRRREIPHRHRPVGQGHARHLQAAGRPDRCIRPRYIDPYMQSHPMPAERVRALEELAQREPLLGQEGLAGAAGAPRPDARQALRLHGPAATRSRAAIRSSDNSLPARYARAISTYRFANSRGALGADRRPDPDAAATTPISTSSRARRCWKAASRPRRSRRCAARCSSRPTRR